jgi:hypothetical protein
VPLKLITSPAAYVAPAKGVVIVAVGALLGGKTCNVTSLLDILPEALLTTTEYTPEFAEVIDETV